MSPENTAKLYTAFPQLYRGRVKDYTISSMCWGFCCGDGWFDLLWQLSSQIEQRAHELGIDPNSEAWPEVSEVKAKFSMLRFFGKNLDFAEDLIEQAEADSQVSCEECGKAGIERRLPRERFRVLCDEHAPQEPVIEDRGIPPQRPAKRKVE